MKRVKNPMGVSLLAAFPYSHAAINFLPSMQAPGREWRWSPEQILRDCGLICQHRAPAARRHTDYRIIRMTTYLKSSM